MTTKIEKPAAMQNATDVTVPGAVAEQVATARQFATGLTGALAESGKAYVAGLTELGKTLNLFGRETLNDANAHLRATMQAKSLREVAELQAAYMQQRVEVSATHVKEFVDQTRVKTEDVIAPLTALLNKAA